MVKNIFGVLMYAAFVAVILFVLGILTVNYSPKVRAWFETKRQERIVEKYQKAADELEQKRKSDIDGGKTPEETINMFLVAIKSGDIEKASKYYEVVLQEKALTGLREELQKYGNLEHTINYFEEVMSKGEKKCYEGLGKILTCSVGYESINKGVSTSTIEISGRLVPVYISAGSKNRISVVTQANINNIWKIIQPY